MTGSFDTAAHVIQRALAPVFLLMAAGSLPNDFSLRFARVDDPSYLCETQTSQSVIELNRLRLRPPFHDVAVLAVAALRCFAIEVILTKRAGSPRPYRCQEAAATPSDSNSPEKMV